MARKQQQARRAMVSRLMGELVICGGQLWTRQGLYQELRASCGERCADYTAFGPRTLVATPAEIAARAGGPLDRRNG